MITIDTTNMCSHLQRKLFEEDGIWNLLSDYRDIQKNFVKLGTKMRIIK